MKVNTRRAGAVERGGGGGGVREVLTMALQHIDGDPQHAQAHVGLALIGVQRGEGHQQHVLHPALCLRCAGAPVCRLPHLPVDDLRLPGLEWL